MTTTFFNIKQVKPKVHRFLNPRTDYSFRTLRMLREYGISYPYHVSSGPKGNRITHFLGSEYKAEKMAKTLKQIAELSVGKLILVLDDSFDLTLSEPGAVFLSPAEADELANGLEAAPDVWESAKAKICASAT